MAENILKKGRPFLRLKMLLLGAALCLLTGCGKAEVSDKTADKEQAVGRYVETAYELPEEINRNGGITRQSDGTLSLVSFGSGLWVSADGGQSWENKETSWYPLISEVYCLSAAVGPDGSVAASCSGQMSGAVRAVYGEAVDEDWEGNYCVFAGPDESLKVVDFGFRQEDGSCIASFCYKEDGRLFASDMNGKIYEVKNDAGSPSLAELFTADRAVGSMGFCGSILMAVGHDRLYLYDLEERTLLGQDGIVDEFIQQVLGNRSPSYTGGGYPLAVAGEQKENTVYLACEDGLYRHALGGSMMEQIIDGALSTFGDSTAALYNVFPLENGEFLAQFGVSAGLIRYTWNAKIPSMPEKELRIYSLEENRNIRQAATVYKKSRTDLYVRYEVGMEGESGITKEDALKKLNAQILSGEGPDVLVLDGLPARTYAEKGMLADLYGILGNMSGDDAVFPNLLESFAGGGALYGMPLCIKVPVLAGDAHLVEKMTDLASFADGMEELRRENPSGGLLGIYDEKTLLRLFGTVSAPAWQKEDGSLDQEAVAEFYRQAERIWKAEQSGKDPEEADYMEKTDKELARYGTDPVENRMQACQNVLYLPAGYAKLAAGCVDGIQLCLDNVTSVLRTDESLDYTCFNGQSRQTFLPKTMVGMNAQSANREDAEDFIRNIFSRKIQENLYDGFPVNQAAFKESFNFLEENAENGSMFLTLKNGEEKELTLYWPDRGEKKKFTDLVENLKTPVIGGEYLTELVCEAGVQVLEGRVSAENAASKIASQAAIYLAE